MIFHFEFSGARGWEAMGAGTGTGGDPLPKALTDLRSLHGGSLPAGRYQFIAAAGNGARWREFRIGNDGELLD
ncbi:MAG TPA: hypothetical protein VHB53_10060 [Solirubrobacterales bacterium]|nr:hypothetical protein [Solirubrobacterales bacterium]